MIKIYNEGAVLIMTPNEYQKKCLRTMSDIEELRLNNKESNLLNGLMGLNGEAGECIDILKKYLFQGHEFPIDHLAKELGDVAWYLAIAADAIGYDLEDIFQMNIDKLEERYPDGFESKRSKNRSRNDI